VRSSPYEPAGIRICRAFPLAHSLAKSDEARELIKVGK
jgi:hypothetical protein